ncbi:putative metaxin-1 [Apostichopus japonicus]|uniref:Putative metaxin-1 n=1 Tax=Stichopus japonicus TaxID=307972 RepID=A0A2G8LPK1_STIJA|nr:putative metaxin-1 [Apostichopus japonicus]
MNPGMNPVMNPGMDPGMYPWDESWDESWDEPGLNPGMNPVMNPGIASALYPIFRANEKVFKDSDEEVIKYLKEKNFNADAGLTDQERADVLAYAALMEERLQPALLYLWWVDAKNHVEFSRPWYARAFHFPFNYFLPGRIHRAAEERLESTRGGNHILPEELRSKVFKDAKDCLDLLSEKLNEQQFFFGDSPSSLDALVFSYLAPILRVPFPNNELKDHVKQSENLWMYCSRILQRYFPATSEDAAEQKRNETMRDTPNSLDDDPHKVRNIVLSVAVALCALVGYGLMSGLVQLEVVGHEGEEDDSEDGMAE